jgi:hypothetical protein
VIKYEIIENSPVVEKFKIKPILNGFGKRDKGRRKIFNDNEQLSQDYQRIFEIKMDENQASDEISGSASNKLKRKGGPDNGFGADKKPKMQ